MKIGKHKLSGAELEEQEREEWDEMIREIERRQEAAQKEWDDMVAKFDEWCKKVREKWQKNK